MSQESRFRSKSPDELSKQLETAQQILGSQDESSLIPMSQNREEIVGSSSEEVASLSVDDIKKKYALRYEMYVNLMRHQGSLDANAEAHLSDEDIMEMKKWLTALNSLDGYITRHYGGEETLRGRQINVFEDLKQFLEDGKKKGYVKLPTGAGKTVLFTEFIEALNLKTLVVVPKKILVGQTADKMEEFAPDLEYGRVFSVAQEFGRQVTIITYDSLVSKLESGQINPNDYEALILDEAHKALGQKRQDALKKFDKQLIVGFTATPDFSETKKLSQILPEEIHAMNLEEGVAEVMLCSMSSMVVHTEADLSMVQIDKDRYSEKQLAEAVNIESRNQAAVKLYKNQFEGQLALAYCVGVTHAEKVAEEFNKAGVPAMAISGKTKPKERDKILAQFKKGEIKVLCNADLLIEGFDEPEASVCFNLRPTMSWIHAEQRGGRVMRLNPNNPNKHAYVFDFLDKGISAKNTPVLFADVVGGALFLSKEETATREKGEEDRKPAEQKVFINIPGLQVTYDAQEVMRLVASLRDEREKAEDGIFRYNERSALARLEEAFVEWSKLDKEIRGRFNGRWLRDHNFSGLYHWTKTNIHLKKLVARSENQALKTNFDIMERRTEADALAELDEAFSEWDRLPKEVRGKFNARWLSNNDFDNLYGWSTRNMGSIENLVAKSSNERLKANFHFAKKTEAYASEDVALAKLEEAFVEWSKLPEDARDIFNATWLKHNNFLKLYDWTVSNTSLDDLVAKSSNQQLKDNFESINRYTETTALAKLEEAFVEWSKLPEATRGKFNPTWLYKNGYKTLADWSLRKKVPLASLVAKSQNEELKQKFEKVELTRYTETTALAKLEEAFAIWHSRPEVERRRFNGNWLRKNGFKKLERWCLEHTSLFDLVAKSQNTDLKKAFVKMG